MTSHSASRFSRRTVPRFLASDAMVVNRAVAKEAAADKVTAKDKAAANKAAVSKAADNKFSLLH
jgi:hypothetical protein